MKARESKTALKTNKSNVFTEIFLVIRPTLQCNLNCSYCYIAADNRKRSKSLSIQTLEHFLQVLINLGCRTVSFSWQGGEPTLIGRHQLQVLIDTADRVLNDSKVTTYHCLHTNGVLIDDDWAKFFLDRGMSVGVSLDAGQEMHDRYRCPWGTVKSYSVFNRAMGAISILCKAGVNVEATSTIVEPNNVDVETIYRFFQSLPVHRINVEPCLDFTPERRHMGGNLWLLPYFVFMEKLYRRWVAELGHRPPIQYFDAIQKFSEGHGSDACHMSGCCWNHLMLQPNGDVFPCDQFGDFDKYRVGNASDYDLGQRLLIMPEGPLGKEAVRLKASCTGCKWYSICHGGCLYQRLCEFNSYDQEQYPNQCQRNHFFSAVVR
jgi:uncharacterized protein